MKKYQTGNDNEYTLLASIATCSCHLGTKSMEYLLRSVELEAVSFFRVKVTLEKKTSMMKHKGGTRRFIAPAEYE